MQSIIWRSEVDHVKCYQMCMGKQSKSFALVLTSFLSSGSSRCYKEQELYTRWEPHGFFILVYCSFWIVELKSEISAYPGIELSVLYLRAKTFPAWVATADLMLWPPQDLSGFIHVFEVSICSCTLLSHSLGDKQLKINYITRVIKLRVNNMSLRISKLLLCKVLAWCENSWEGWVWSLSNTITLYFPITYYTLIFQVGVKLFFLAFNCDSHFFCGGFFVCFFLFSVCRQN